MCGESGGILGMDPAIVVEKMRSSLPHNFKSAQGRVRADGVIFTMDDSTGRVTSIEPISF
jgi:calcineurin-like phosphoesterase